MCSVGWMLGVFYNVMVTPAKTLSRCHKPRHHVLKMRCVERYDLDKCCEFVCVTAIAGKAFSCTACVFAVICEWQ